MILKGQKLNEKAPNHLTAYEKLDGKWELVTKIDLNTRVVIPGMDLSVVDTLKLKSSNSEVAIDASIYHCALNNRGVCYIDEFQKPLKRMSSNSAALSFTANPTMQ